MTNLKTLLKNKLFSLKTGFPVKVINNGKPTEQITIQYKDYYFFIDLDAKSGEPTGNFGWSTDPTMNPTVPIRNILIATRGKLKG